MPVRNASQPSIAAVPSAQILCAIRFLTAAAPEPVPKEMLIRSVREKLGYRRTGSHIRTAIAAQIRVAEKRRLITRAGELVSADCISINDYSLAELQDCTMEVVTRGPIDRAEVIVRATRALGFSRTGGQIEERFKSAINGLIRRKRLAGDSRHVWRTRQSSARSR